MSDALKPSRLGLKLDAPEAGDIVTVRVKRRPKQQGNEGVYGAGPLSLFAHGDTDEADNPQHYRMTALWRVVAVNGGQAVVESMSGYATGRREVWPIALHEWFEASELADALNPPPPQSLATEER